MWQTLIDNNNVEHQYQFNVSKIFWFGHRLFDHIPIIIIYKWVELILNENIIINIIYSEFIANGSTMRVTCGTNIELACPIRSLKKPDEVVCPWEENYQLQLNML